jgi:hypothetical protein
MDCTHSLLCGFALQGHVFSYFRTLPTSNAVIVDEVVPGGAADKNGRIVVGDVLAACSAVVFKNGQSGVCVCVHILCESGRRSTDGALGRTACASHPSSLARSSPALTDSLTASAHTSPSLARRCRGRDRGARRRAV